MVTRRVTILTLALLVGCVGEAPESGPGDQAIRSIATEDHAPPLRLSEAQENGKRLFETVCWTCHGAAGRGDGPVAVAGSIPAPPSFLVGEYSRMTADDFVEALSYIPALVYPGEIPGSAIAGSALYARRCVACHGEQGRGDGMAAQFLVFAPPADFTEDSLIADRNWPALFQQIREGGQAPHTSMPPWGMLFGENEMWDLVAYIAILQPGAFPTLEEATGP